MKFSELVLDLVPTQTSATVGYVNVALRGTNWVGKPPIEPFVGDIWLDPVKNLAYIWSGSNWELFMSQPAEVKAKYIICRYCGRPLARNKGDHSCDGCGSALEA